jgi:hypothetical protein
MAQVPDDGLPNGSQHLKAGAAQSRGMVKLSVQFHCAVLLARGFESLYELINIRYGRDSFLGHGIRAKFFGYMSLQFTCLLRGGAIGLLLNYRRYTQNPSMSAIAWLRHLTNGRDLTVSLRLVVLSKVTVNSNV